MRDEEDGKSQILGHRGHVLYVDGHAERLSADRRRKEVKRQHGTEAEKNGG